MNTIKDLLRDLVTEALDKHENYGIEATDRVVKEGLVEEYHDRFIKEISKYFELEEIK